MDDDLDARMSRWASALDGPVPRVEAVRSKADRRNKRRYAAIGALATVLIAGALGFVLTRASSNSDQVVSAEGSERSSTGGYIRGDLICPSDNNSSYSVDLIEPSATPEVARDIAFQAAGVDFPLPAEPAWRIIRQDATTVTYVVDDEPYIVALFVVGQLPGGGWHIERAATCTDIAGDGS